MELMRPQLGGSFVGVGPGSVNVVEVACVEKCSGSCGGRIVEHLSFCAKVIQFWPAKCV